MCVCVYIYVCVLNQNANLLLIDEAKIENNDSRIKVCLD